MAMASTAERPGIHRCELLREMGMPSCTIGDGRTSRTPYLAGTQTMDSVLAVLSNSAQTRLFFIATRDSDVIDSNENR
jgi:hypothetical protein